MATQTAAPKPPPSPPPVEPATAAQSASPASPQAVPAAEKFEPLRQGRFKLVRAAENSDLGNLFAAILPVGTPFSRVLRPDFWSNCAQTIAHRGDGKLGTGTGHQIEVHSDDARFFGRLYVLQCQGVGTHRTAVDVEVLEYHEFDAAPRPASPIPYIIDPRGPFLKYCVVRTCDGSVVSSGHETEDEARRVMGTITRNSPARG